MKIYFIRHGKTEGNLFKKYIGSTDEGLCEQGIFEIKAKMYPEVQSVVTSPMKRCRETLNLIYGASPYVVEEDFREMDFGLFEGKNYEALSGNLDYQKWIDSNCSIKIPGGESKAEFVKRSFDAFKRMCDRIKNDTAVICHGGTIMAVLSEIKGGDFYDYHVENGQGYLLDTDTREIIKMDYRK